MKYKHLILCTGILSLGILLNMAITKFDTTPVYNKVILAEGGEGEGSSDLIVEPAALCNKFGRFYNNSVGKDSEGDTTSSCSETTYDAMATAIASGNFSTVKPHLIMNTGQKVYFEASNWIEQPDLSAGTAVAAEDKKAIRIFIDIDGDTGSSLLWEDVFPFYITESGKAIPAKNNSRPGLAASSNRYLSFNIVYDDYASSGHSGQRVVKPIPNGTNLSFTEAACRSGYVRSTNYCTINGTLISPASVCVNSNGTINDIADCRMRIKKPWNIN